MTSRSRPHRNARVLEKWLAKKERELHSLQVDAIRQWGSTPRRPDSYSGAALLADDFIDNRGGAGECGEGFNDYPMWCAPASWSISLGNFGDGGAVGSPPFWPGSERCSGSSGTAYMDYFAYKNYELVRVPNGTPTWPTEAVCSYKLLSILDHVATSLDTHVAVWRANVDWPDDVYSHPSDPTSSDITTGVVELVIFHGTLTTFTEDVIDFPYALLNVGWVRSSGSVVISEWGSTDAFHPFCTLGPLPRYDSPTDNDYDSPNTTHSPFIFRSRRPIVFNHSDCFQVWPARPIYGNRPA